MVNMILFGIGGMNGSGKDTVALMLVERHGFLFASATEMFLDELKMRGWPPDREHKAMLSAEWRRQYGMGVIVDKGVEMFNKEPGKYHGVIIGSLRHPGEADRIHELGGKMIWTDGDPRVRYERIQANLHERVDTHVEHGKTFEEFLAEEAREMSHIGDSATLNMAGVKERADTFIINNEDDIETFKNQAEKALGLAA